MGLRESSLEGMVNLSPAWAGRSVLVTGHTGFKGCWLSLWLQQLGARVHGFALDPPTRPSLCELTRLPELLASDTRADLADRETLQAVLELARPEVVFHLAAQSLVRESYREPITTFQTNVMGTVLLLDALRALSCVRAVVVVTTDKVYRNREWVYPYREPDALGGHDPYSASKAATEIAAASYRDSFLRQSGVQLATARAGNVIGGGDWSEARLVPDCLRAFARGEPVRLRYPGAVRPWQYVLEPLLGYIMLAERLLGSDSETFASAWNFGPEGSDDRTVGEVGRALADLWGPQAQLEFDDQQAHPHEAGLLRLDITRARAVLGWQPLWPLERGLRATVDWYRAWLVEQDMRLVSQSQILDYAGRN